MMTNAIAHPAAKPGNINGNEIFLEVPPSVKKRYKLLCF